MFYRLPPHSASAGSQPLRLSLLLGTTLLLGACGGSTGPGPTSLASTTPLAPPAATPAAPPVATTVNYDTAEYQRSNATADANVLDAWKSGASGAGVVVGIIDSGLSDPSGEFSGRIINKSRDVTTQSRTLTDESGHGTAVAAVLAASRNDHGIVGIAPGATLAVMRADSGDCASGCHFSDVAIAAGIDASIAAGARVINISLGGSSASRVLREAFARAASADRVIVISAGNDGEADADPLARAALASAGNSHVIVAGASSSTGTISSFSNRAGTTQNNYLLALGERVRSLDTDGNAILYSGTSFSAPAISGAIALLAESFPALSAGSLVDILLTSADDVGSPGTDAINGRGLLNIASAMAPSGTTSLKGSNVAVTVADPGFLGSAFGDGLSQNHALASVGVVDSHGREYALPLASRLRHASAGRLRGRLLSASLAQADTSAQIGDFALALQLRATASAPGTAPAFRATDSDVADLGFAQRGVDAHAGARNPLRETSLRLAAPDGLALVMASGQLASSTLPGSGRQGFVTDDALSLDDGSGADGRLLLMAEKSHGPLTIALAASRRSFALSHSPGLSRLAHQQRLTLAASLDHGPWQIALQASDGLDRGAFLGTRLAPGFGISGGRSQTIGGAVEYASNGLSLRAAGALGRLTPHADSHSLLTADGPLHTTSWSLAGSAPAGAGRLRLQLAGPMVVTGGQFRLANGARVAAAALARETAAELGYDLGPLSLMVFHRQNAGNIHGMTDSGGALSFRLGL